MSKIIKFEDYICEEFEINRIQFLYKKTLKKLGVKLYYANTYELSLSSLFPLVDKFTNIPGFIFEHTNENIVLLTIYAFSVMTYEGIEKLETIREVLNEKGFEDYELKNIVSVFINLKNLYIELLTTEQDNVRNFEDIVKNTAMFIPFTNILMSLIRNERLNLEMFLGTYDEMKTFLGEDGFEILKTKITNKMVILVGSTRKIQNPDNLRPYLINNDLKSPLYKSDYVLTQDEINEHLSKRRKN